MAELCCDPDDTHPCFKCKAKYWREQGVSIQYSYGGRDEFHGPTIRERQELQMKEAKQAGRSIEPVGQRWV